MRRGVLLRRRLLCLSIPWLAYYDRPTAVYGYSTTLQFLDRRQSPSTSSFSILHHASSTSSTSASSFSHHQNTRRCSLASSLAADCTDELPASSPPLAAAVAASYKDDRSDHEDHHHHHYPRHSHDDEEDVLLRRLQQSTQQLLMRLRLLPSSDTPTTTNTNTLLLLQDVERLLYNWGRVGTVRAATQAEHLLEAVVKALKEKNYASGVVVVATIPPRCYALVIDAWARVGNVDQAEAVFDRIPLQQHQHDRVCYHALLHANSASGRIHRCLELLSILESSEQAHLQPTTAEYNLVLAAYVRNGDATASEQLLKRMVDRCVLQDDGRQGRRAVIGKGGASGGDERMATPARQKCYDHHPEANVDVVTPLLLLPPSQPRCDCAPDLTSYNWVLDAHAQSRKAGAGTRAQTILQAMHASYQTGDLEFRPDARSYSAVMKALIKSASLPTPTTSTTHPPSQSSNTRYVVERAAMDHDHTTAAAASTTLLVQLQGLLQEAKQTGVELDSYVYTILLDALANSRTVPDAPEQAEELLDEMEREGLANDVAYNTVLKVYKNHSHRRPDAPRRAEAVLRRMEERKCVGTISYTTVAGMYANRGDPDSAQCATDLLQRTLQLNVANVQTFNSVLHAWVRCGHVARAELILTDMETYHCAGREEISPNVVSYSTIMSGWAKSRDADSLAKTKATFDRMVAMYESGNLAAAPNSFSYATLVSAYSRCRDNPEAAQAAQDLLMELYAKYERDRSPDLRPNAQLVSNVIDAWQKSGCHDAGKKAESLLNWALEVSKDDVGLRPNEYTFASTIAAWGKSRTMGKAVQARRVLHRMIDLHSSGQIEARPNTHCFTAVINSCAYSENDSLEKSQAVRIAIDAFKDLAASQFGDPNEVTYSSLLTALRNLLPPGTERSSAVQFVFQKATEAGLVDELALRRVQTVLTIDELKQLSVPIDRSGRIDTKRLPEGWQRNLMGRN